MGKKFIKPVILGGNNGDNINSTPFGILGGKLK
jgi:hypothetical protein